MFSGTVKKTSFNEIKAGIESSKTTRDKVYSILSKASEFERLALEDLNYLLNSEAWNFKDEIQKVAHHITLQRHGRVIKFYAPLYVSNECNNQCVYCGFNITNNVKRVTLTMDEIIKEADIIKKMGIEHLLIVAGECPKTVGLGYLKEVSRILANKFSTVSVEVAPLETQEYQELFGSGIEGVTCYQETYNPELYSSYHKGGPKRDITRRLDTLDRAGSAGMRFLGLGTLLGLSDPKTEACFMAQHARYLEKNYWKSSVSVSFPRIRPNESGFQPLYSMNEEEMLHIISVLRLFLPDANLILSTRESADFRDKAVFYGINQMSAGSKTNPLGYSDETGAGLGIGTCAGEQFEIADLRTPSAIANKLSEYGYDPVFKDWDRGFRNA